MPLAAWPIICSNGGPSVRRKQKPRIVCCFVFFVFFCAGFPPDDWPTSVPRRRSQLKVPSVKRVSDATPPLPPPAHRFAVAGVCCWWEGCLVFFLPSSCVPSLPFVSASFLSFLLFLRHRARLSKSNFILAVPSHSACTNYHCSRSKRSRDLFFFEY